MNKKLIIFILMLSCFFSNGQNSLKKLLKKSNTQFIPYISVQELATLKKDVILLDTREISEYNVSHLKNAAHVGYNFFDLNKTTKLIKDKSKLIVVYCSLGIRSEDIAEQLYKEGYTNIKNLYGGIFEWKNNNNPVFNNKSKQTERVHAFSKSWGKWLKKGIKVYNSKSKNEKKR